MKWVLGCLKLILLYADLNLIFLQSEPFGEVGARFSTYIPVIYALWWGQIQVFHSCFCDSSLRVRSESGSCLYSCIIRALFVRLESGFYLFIESYMYRDPFLSRQCISQFVFFRLIALLILGLHYWSLFSQPILWCLQSCSETSHLPYWGFHHLDQFYGVDGLIFEIGRLLHWEFRFPLFLESITCQEDLILAKNRELSKVIFKDDSLTMIEACKGLTPPISIQDVIADSCDLVKAF